MANELNLDTLLEQAAGTADPATGAQEGAQQEITPEPVDPNVTVTEQLNETQVPTDNPNNTDEDGASQQTQEPSKKPNPMKEVRDKLNSEQRLRTKIENAMQRWSDGNYKCKLRDYKTEDGKLDYDAFIKAMDNEDNENKAKSNNRSPEIQAELDRIEKEKQEIQKERLRVSMDRELAYIQVSMHLSRDDINKFFKDALAVKRNPYQWLAAGGNLEDLYYIIYRDDIINKRVEERASSRTPQVQPHNAPMSNPATPSAKAPKSADGVSLNELLTKANR